MGRLPAPARPGRGETRAKKKTGGIVDIAAEGQQNQPDGQAVANQQIVSLHGKPLRAGKIRPGAVLRQKIPILRRFTGGIGGIFGWRCASGHPRGGSWTDRRSGGFVVVFPEQFARFSIVYIDGSLHFICGAPDPGNDPNGNGAAPPTWVFETVLACITASTPRSLGQCPRSCSAGLHN